MKFTQFEHTKDLGSKRSEYYFNFMTKEKVSELPTWNPPQPTKEKSTIFEVSSSVASERSRAGFSGLLKRQDKSLPSLMLNTLTLQKDYTQLEKMIQQELERRKGKVQTRDTNLIPASKSHTTITGAVKTTQKNWEKQVKMAQNFTHRLQNNKMILQKDQQVTNLPKIKKPFLMANRNNRLSVPSVTTHMRSQSVLKSQKVEEVMDPDHATKLRQIPAFRRSINCDL